MSSIPGYSLEDFVAWNLDLVVEGQGDPNMSLCIAEAMGTASKRRPVLTKEQFKPILALFEPHREYVEDNLDRFEEDTQSWRDYAGCAFEGIPEEVYDAAFAIEKKIISPSDTDGDGK